MPAYTELTKKTQRANHSLITGNNDLAVASRSTRCGGAARTARRGRRNRKQAMNDDDLEVSSLQSTVSRKKERNKNEEGNNVTISHRSMEKG